MAQLVYEAIIEQDASPTATDSQRSKSVGSNYSYSGHLDSITVLPGQLYCDHQGCVSLHDRTSLQMEVPSTSTGWSVSDVSTLPYDLINRLTSSPHKAAQSSSVAVETEWCQETDIESVSSSVKGNLQQASAQSPISQDNEKRTRSASVQYQSEHHQIVSFPEMSTVTNGMSNMSQQSQVAQETGKACTPSTSSQLQLTPKTSSESSQVCVFPQTLQVCDSNCSRLALAGSDPERSHLAGPPNGVEHSGVVSLTGPVNQSTLPLGTSSGLFNGPRRYSLASRFSFHTPAIDPEFASSRAANNLDSMRRGVLGSGLLGRPEASSSSLLSNGELQASNTVPLVDTMPPRVRWSSKLVGFLVHLFCILIVYPLFFTLLPLLVVFKLLCCCIPCKKFHTVRDVNGHLSPFYASRLSGTYYYTLVVFKESISFKDFCGSLKAVLQHTSLQTNTLQVLRLKLAAVLKTRGWLSWWRAENVSNLASHVHPVDRKMTTTNDLSNYVAELSNSEPQDDSSLWAAYFIPTYIGRSAVVIKTHHCLASGKNLRDIFVGLLDADHHEIKPTFPIRKVSKFVAILKAPSVFLRYLMCSTLLNDLRPLSLNGRARIVYSEPYELNPIQTCAAKYGVTVGTVLLSCLTGAIRKLLLQSKATIRDMTFALPVTTGSQLSFFSVKLPVSEACSTKQLLKINNLLWLHSEEAVILLSAAKLASLFLCSSAIDSVSNAMLHKVTGIFSVVDLPNDPLYFDFYSVSSVACWPPRFSNIGLSVTIVCYKETFRVCIATDRNVSEWPDILMNWFITSCSDLIKSL